MNECVQRPRSPRPPAPMMRLASPLSIRESQRMGGKRISVLTNGALSSAARSGFMHGPVLRDRLEEDEDHDDFEDDAEHDAPGAEDVLGHDADQGGRHQLAHQHEQQNGIEEVGRVLDQLGQRAGAVALVVDQRLGLDFARAHQARLGHGQHARAGQEHGDDHDEDGVLDVEARRWPRGWAPPAPLTPVCPPGRSGRAAAAPGPPCARLRRPSRGPCRGGGAARARRAEPPRPRASPRAPPR